MFTPEELQVMYQLLNRVQLQGAEAKAVVSLMLKVEGLLKPAEEPKEKK